MKQIAIIGDGGWGTALGLTLLRNGHRVRIWGPFPEYIETIRTRGENTDYLPGVPLPKELEWTADRKEVVRGADVVVLAVPTKHVRSALPPFAVVIPSNALVVSVAKGLDASTFHRMTEVAEKILAAGPVAALSGPSFAAEVARGLPCAVTMACADPARAGELQGVFSSRSFRVYTSDDTVGVELGGALKNVIAVAVGVSDGLGLGHSASAALITRGLAEITRLGMALGAHAATFAGLSGMGDLVLTCTSRLSRNYTVGERIGRGEKVKDILAGMKQVAEGVTNCVIARDLAVRAGVEAPIIAEISAVLHEGKDPRVAVASLLARDPRPERDR